MSCLRKIVAWLRSLAVSLLINDHVYKVVQRVHVAQFLNNIKILNLGKNNIHACETIFMIMETFPCTAESRVYIKANLANFKRSNLAPGNLRQAAVALTIVDYRGEGGLNGLGNAPDTSAALILTRRSGGLKNHAGQWAFPGGSIDPGEDPVQTAFRELEEEVGLSLPADRLLGRLDDFITRSGFHITPLVIWGGTIQQLDRNEEEVASIHRIPCKELFRQDAPVLEGGEESGRPILFMPVGNSWIATPTAAILYQFREVALAGRPTRVAHFEQPYFAWS
jgi:8-oxo-dGTP pyrophosphatase MutT (NUDIX family)